MKDITLSSKTCNKLFDNALEVKRELDLNLFNYGEDYNLTIYYNGAYDYLCDIFKEMNIFEDFQRYEVNKKDIKTQKQKVNESLMEQISRIRDVLRTLSKSILFMDEDIFTTTNLKLHEINASIESEKEYNLFQNFCETYAAEFDYQCELNEVECVYIGNTSNFYFIPEGNKNMQYLYEDIHSDSITRKLSSTKEEKREVIIRYLSDYIFCEILENDIGNEEIDKFLKELSPKNLQMLNNIEIMEENSIDSLITEEDDFNEMYIQFSVCLNEYTKLLEKLTENDCEKFKKSRVFNYFKNIEESLQYIEEFKIDQLQYWDEFKHNNDENQFLD